jgi:ADP-ribosyl-[dinitrogen reductase] hydrolase
MAVKTSESHPLRIDIVKPISSSGSIGMTLCPGKQQDDGLSGRWKRNLDLDIKAIVDAGAVTVVTLMESHELKNLGVKNLGHEIEKSGLKWHHLPIVDRCAPADPFELQWEIVGEELRNNLLKGELIVLHCMGGLGRTGTIAARLLTELGESRKSAIKRVRQARPGAIETRVQENYIYLFKV